VAAGQEEPGGCCAGAGRVLAAEEQQAPSSGEVLVGLGRGATAASSLRQASSSLAGVGAAVVG